MRAAVAGDRRAVELRSIPHTAAMWFPGDWMKFGRGECGAPGVVALEGKADSFAALRNDNFKRCGGLKAKKSG